MTPDELAAIKARADALTPFVDAVENHPMQLTDTRPEVVDLLVAMTKTAQDVPALLAEVERLRGIDAEWRRIMARPHPENGCWGAHQMRSQDACMGCERDAARAEVERLREVVAGFDEDHAAAFRRGQMRARGEVARLRAQVATLKHDVSHPYGGIDGCDRCAALAEHTPTTTTGDTHA